MHTTAAVRSFPAETDNTYESVVLPAALMRRGFTRAAIGAQLSARRWQRAGRAIVMHNGPLSSAERRRVALLNCGPRAALTSFTALHEYGLAGWERGAIDVLVPAGARIRRAPGIDIRIHYTGNWRAVPTARVGSLHAVLPALLRAAGTFATPRPACAILAAAAQQRLVHPDELAPAITRSVRLRHRALLLSVTHDIAQGAQALSEIDFGRLCRAHGIPAPRRQAVRVDASGRRRYLDAEWLRRDGRRVVAEVDGALHLIVRRWWDDQLRQNELMINDSLVLRFPSAIVRCDETLVANQLRRALTIR